MAFRFVHSADIHLDSPLVSLAMRDAALGELIGTATRRAFTALIDLCLAERVDALLLAGDLYDGDATSMKTALFLARELKRLDDAGVRTFVIRGNHDHLSRITRELVLPDSVHVFGGRAEAVTLETAAGAVAIHGLSFAQAHAHESLLPRYRAPVADAINIGLMHTSLDGTANHDPYAPCRTQDLQAGGWRYWALGHIHKRSVVTGDCTVVMPGIPQGRHIKESGCGSATLVSVADDGSITLEDRPTALAQFERVDVDVGGLTEWRALAERIGRRLAEAREAATAEHLVARVKLVGTTPLAWAMRRDRDLLRTEADSRAEDAGRTWIEQVEVDVDAGDLPDAAVGPVAELRRTMVEEICGSSENVEAIVAAIDELRAQLPAECRDAFGSGEAATAELARKLALSGCDDILARLMPMADEAA